MKNKIKFILTFLILGLVISFVTFQKSSAAPTELRLTTSPLPINLKTTPGSTISANIKIKNDGTETENLRVFLMKFKADPVTGATILGEREAMDNYFDWVTFSDPTFSLPPGEWKTETMTINVPSSAAFDYFYAVTFFRVNQAFQSGERQTILNGGTATMVLLTVDVPGAKKELSLDQFTVNKNIFEFLPVDFSVKIKNTGDIHIIPQGNIFITQNGKDIATLNVNETQGSILPNSPRTFQSQWIDGFPLNVTKLDGSNNPLKDANGNIEKELKWNWADASKLRFGKYTAKLVAIYNDGQRDMPMEGEVSFWVIPWRLVGGALVILFFVIVGLKSILQNSWKKISNLTGKK